jgi:hypothetical protein
MWMLTSIEKKSIHSSGGSFNNFLSIVRNRGFLILVPGSPISILLPKSAEYTPTRATRNPPSDAVFQAQTLKAVTEAFVQCNTRQYVQYTF